MTEKKLFFSHYFKEFIPEIVIRYEFISLEISMSKKEKKIFSLLRKQKKLLQFSWCPGGPEFKCSL